MKTYETWADFNEKERAAWPLKFIELAEKELVGYNGTLDSYAEFPWCEPWSDDEEGVVLSPEAYLDSIKKDLQDILNDNLKETIQ